jgi:glycyl-tRNA synthetase alpha chain
MTASRSRTTYQQAGGLDLSPVSVELTYGLERFAMSLQGVDNVYDLQWAPGVKYRDVRFLDEVQQSKYAFGQVALADGKFSELHRDLFDRYYDFAKALLDSGLVLPALDYCLKCSHVFNLLDSSGSIGVTERTAYILRVRQLAVAIARAWVDLTPTDGAARSCALPSWRRGVRRPTPALTSQLAGTD